MNFLVVAIIVIITVYILRYFLKSRVIAENPERPARIFHEEECPICLEDKTFAVQASCGHEFCAACILGALDRSSTCPLCRRPISVLFRNFEECPEDLRKKLIRYNAFHDDRSAWQVICEAPVMIQRFFSHNDYQNLRTTATILALIAVGFGYILLPHDLLDEDVYGLTGMIDDFGVVLGIIIYISILIFKAVVQEALRAN